MAIFKNPRAPLSYRTIGAAVGLADILAIMGAALGGDIAYRFNVLNHHFLVNPPAIGAGFIAALVFIPLAQTLGLYRLPAVFEMQKQIWPLALVSLATVLIVTALLFLMKIGSDLSRGSFVFFAVFEFPALLISRAAAATTIGALISDSKMAGQSVVTIGSLSELDRVNPGHLFHQFGFHEVKRVALPSGDTPDIRAERQNLIENALAEAREYDASGFVVGVAWNDLTMLSEITHALRASPLPVSLLPDLTIRTVLSRRSGNARSEAYAVEIQRAPMTLRERLVKRTLDIALASIAIIVLAPVLVIAACAVYLDTPGPVIFKQRRNGFNRRQFMILKFRTMHVMEDSEHVLQARRDDCRVTRVGRILRRTSVDELPQLFNVLKGEMSLVGPRPHALAHDDQYRRLISTYCWRHHVKPGITGWAQINGWRGETAHLSHMQKRIEHDIWYINNWSLGLDIRILWQTCVDVLSHEAY